MLKKVFTFCANTIILPFSKLNHFNINAFNQRYNTIITTWDEMKKLSSQREREISVS